MTNDHSSSNVLDKPKTAESNTDKKPHPWRVCPIGQHFVKTHSLTIPPSKDHPDGQIVTRHDHCANNPTRHKDLLSFDEIKEVSKIHFSKATNLPNVIKVNAHSEEFDRDIAGWVMYWNDIFSSKHPIDPNVIKALIWSESSFNKNQVTPIPRHPDAKARGLMQLTDSTRSILSDPKGELRNHYIELSESQALDPSANICAGIRWLFRKKVLAKHRLHREPTLDEIIAEYKGVLQGIIDNENPDPHREVPKFRHHYTQILAGRKK